MKYALYKIPNAGLYALIYIDNLNDFNQLSHNKRTKALTPPIVITPVGDIISFNPTPSNFVKIIECNDNEEPLTKQQRYPKNSEEFDYGWVDPEGNTYACGRGGHVEAAKVICEMLNIEAPNGERKLEELKWVKITMPYGRGGQPKKVLCTDNFITKKQADVLLDLNLHLEDSEVLDFINQSEMYW